jgi:hypothetical protein
MNPLYGLLAAPAASTAIDFAGRTAKAVATPFELLLQAATQSTAPTAADDSGEQAEDASTLHDQVAQQLQELLESLGVAPGDQVTLRVDNATGEISADDHPLSDAIEAALRTDSQLQSDIRHLAEADGLFGAAAFVADSKLQVKVAEDQRLATLAWR